MKNLLFLLLILFGVQAYCQQEEKLQKKTYTAQPTVYGNFEDFAYVVDGKIIEKGNLINYAGATLDWIYPKIIMLEDNQYPGAVYFRTTEDPSYPSPYGDDPAWFINGTQVSPFDIRTSRPECYTRIEKLLRDTVIHGTRYNGSIYVDTDEDFFGRRIALSKALEMYSDRFSERAIVHYFSAKSPFNSRPAFGVVIQSNFPIYHVLKEDIGTLKTNRIQFAKSEQYVFHLTDNAYTRVDFSSKWMSSLKAHKIFEDPLSMDTDCPCYDANYDTVNIDKRAFRSAELMPEPYGGEEAYLKKLSNMMRLPTEKALISPVSDSITVRFIVTRNGMLAGLETTSIEKPAHTAILSAIKRQSCTWSVGITSGRPMRSVRKMTIFYSKDRDGGIKSLDNLEYKYDD
ncbi:hypothetical protein [Sphingobacterium pedocola]|uniref:hypothetical protein n=1 Tax=Sphingobacterium pedocola TaxID=2082722 RepID=UPI0018C99011|nr:hypothetical protein [Sphingobacterium pedocola]